jgi:hypothetical protein
MPSLPMDARASQGTGHSRSLWGGMPAPRRGLHIGQSLDRTPVELPMGSDHRRLQAEEIFVGNQEPFLVIY